MSIARVVPHPLRPLLIAALIWTPCAAGAVAFSPAAQAIRPVLSPSAQFQQTVQTQQTRDQLQKSQLQQQLHQDVSDIAKRPNASNQRSQQQQDQADQAQHDRDRAGDQARLQRQQDAAKVSRDANGGG